MRVQSYYFIRACPLCYLFGLFYIFFDDRVHVSYFGCHGIILNDITPIKDPQNTKDTSEIENHVSSTRIIGFQGGPTHDHAVRISLAADFNKALCAGAIYNALYIITAAHCVSNLEHSELIVTAGTGPQYEEYPKQNRSVVSIEIHPDWEADTLQHNVALLKLNDSLYISGGAVFPRELGAPILEDGNITDIWITGWGLHDGSYFPNLTYFMYESTVPVTLVDIETCKDVYQKLGKQVYQHQICAKADNGTGPCTGDSGAPLIVAVLYPNHVWRVFVTALLTSFQDCATGAVDIYTELNYYKNWIESKAGRQCDFNVHDAYVVATPTRISNKQTPKPKGKIDESVAVAICVSFEQLTRTFEIQSPLKSLSQLKMHNKKQQRNVGASLCTNLEWNNCSECQKFVRVKCKNAVSSKTTPQTSLRILGGHDATPNQNPHHVRISTTVDNFINHHACGGIIYNSMYVLTAAKCVYKTIPCNLMVTAGDHNVYIKEDTEQIRQVISINVHEHYDKSDANNNNIAILRLDRPLNFTNHVHSLLLAKKDYPTTEVQSVEICGWGFFNESSYKSDVPKILEVPIINECNCRLEYSSFTGNGVNVNKICAGIRGYGICIGDLGDPWTIQDGKLKYVVALSSFKGHCGTATSVGTKLLAYQDWIVMRAGNQDVVNNLNNK